LFFYCFLVFLSPTPHSHKEKRKRGVFRRKRTLSYITRIMADAAAPAPELKEYPEFPGQKLSKRYVYLRAFVVYEQTSLLFPSSLCGIYLRIINNTHAHFLSLSYLTNTITNTVVMDVTASTKKCSRDKRQRKKKPPKLLPGYDS